MRTTPGASDIVLTMTVTHSLGIMFIPLSSAFEDRLQSNRSRPGSAVDILHFPPLIAISIDHPYVFQARWLRARFHKQRSNVANNAPSFPIAGGTFRMEHRREVTQE